MEKFTLAKRECFNKWSQDTRKAIESTHFTYDSYWIIDPCGSPNLLATIWDLEPSPNASPLFMNTYNEEMMYSGPILIPYAIQSKLTDRLFEQMKTSPIGFLIQIEKKQENILYEHLQNLTECISPSGHRSLFRFYDPRVMYAITTHDDAKVLEQILGPISFIHGWEHGRRASIAAGDGTDHLYRCPEDALHPEELFEHIWKEVKIHTLIQFYQGSFAQSHPEASFFELYDCLEKTYVFLKSIDNTDVESFTFASAFAAAYPDCIWENENITKDFQALHGKKTFFEALKEIGEKIYA